MLPKEIMRRVREIQVRTGRQVADVLAGEYVSVFKGSGIEFDEVNTQIFRLLVEGNPPETIPRCLERFYGASEIRDQEIALREHVDKMCSSPIFKPLFAT